YLSIFDQTLQQMQETGTTVFGYPEAGGGADIAFNLAVPGLDDVRIRRALVLATDSKDINLKAAGGAATMVDTFFAKGTPYYNPKVVQKQNDLKAAQKLVDEYVAQHGPQTFTFYMCDSCSQFGNPVAQQWARLKGITINIQPITSTEGSRR